MLPAHTQLKIRKPGQGGDADNQPRDLRAELLQAEAAHFAKIKGGPNSIPAEPEPATNTSKRQLENGDGEEEEDPEAKRRRILEETRDIDADSEDDDEDESSEDDSDDEDETAELQRELEKIKRERAEKREQEVRASFSLPQYTCLLTTRRPGTREGCRRRGCPRTRYCPWQPVAKPEIRLQCQAPVCCFTTLATDLPADEHADGMTM